MSDCSKKIQLNSQSVNCKTPMKMKAIFIFLLCTGLLAMASCTREYHCSCTYNNQQVYNVDLGMQYEQNAVSKCNSFDSTVTGIMWNCTVY
jgi:hypothetical protein